MNEESFNDYLERLHCSQTSFEELAKTFYEYRKETLDKQKVKEAVVKHFDLRWILEDTGRAKKVNGFLKELGLRE